jgi:tRNA(Ile)-lysidine synthase
MQLIQLGLVSDFELIEQLRKSSGKFVSINRRQLVRRKADGLIELNQSESARFNPAELRFKLSGRAGRVAFHGRKFHWALKRLSGAQARSHQPAEFFDADKIGGEIILRHWRAGDRFQPIGLKSAAKLQDLFVNAKIPAERRRNLVLATTATGEIFWVEKLRIGEHFKLVPETRRVLAWNCPKIAA